MDRTSLGCLVASVLAGPALAEEAAPLLSRSRNAAAPIRASDSYVPAAARAGTRLPSDGRLWFRSEYLLWWFKKSPQPAPLVTRIEPESVGAATSPPPGAIGGAGTTVAIGGQAIDTREHSGGRFTLGYRRHADSRAGLELSYLFSSATPNELASHGRLQRVSTTGAPGTPDFQVPFFDVTGFDSNRVPGETSTAFPGRFFNLRSSGTRSLGLSNRLQGAEIVADLSLIRRAGLRLELLGGLRWMQIRERLSFVFTEATLPDSGRLVGEFSNHVDEFDAHNNFYAGQLGARAACTSGGFFLSATGKIAAGDMRQRVNVSGVTQSNVVSGQILRMGFPRAPVETLAGGFFAQPSNAGSHVRNKFAALGEVELKAGHRMGDWGRVFVDYSFLRASPVVRPGDHIDHNINVSRQAQPAAAAAAGLPVPQQPNGPLLPAFSFHESGFWAQGLSLGVEIHF